MKRTDGIESPDVPEIRGHAKNEFELAEEFIGLDGTGEFPEWRSSEEGEDEFSNREQHVA